MAENELSIATPKWQIWLSYVLSAAPVLMMLMSASFKFIKPAGFDEGMQHIGWSSDHVVSLGIVEVLCVVLYLIPRTAVLGAILIAAYLGGATATHVRVGDPFYIPVLLGMAAWGGLYLRDARVRALIPFRN